MWGLHPGDVRIAKIAERMAQQGRENAGIGITDDQKVAIGMFQPVAQVTGFIADITLTGDVVRPLLLADRLHFRATPVVKDMHLIVERTGIGHLHGVTDRQPDQFHVFGIGGDKQIDFNRPRLHRFIRAQTVVDLRRGDPWRRIFLLP